MRNRVASSLLSAISGSRARKPAKKPAATRSGKGKGGPEGWVACVRPGRILFEMEGVDPATAREAMRLAAHKLPVKTIVVERESGAHGA